MILLTLLSWGCHTLLWSGWGHGSSRGWGPGCWADWQHWAAWPKTCLVLHPLMLLKLGNNLRWDIAQLVLSMSKIASVAKVAVAFFPPATMLCMLFSRPSVTAMVAEVHRSGLLSYLTQSLVLWKIEPFSDPGLLLLSSMASWFICPGKGGLWKAGPRPMPGYKHRD